MPPPERPSSPAQQKHFSIVLGEGTVEKLLRINTERQLARHEHIQNDNITPMNDDNMKQSIAIIESVINTNEVRQPVVAAASVPQQRAYDGDARRIRDELFAKLEQRRQVIDAIEHLTLTD